MTGRWLALRGLVAGPQQDPFLYQRCPGRMRHWRSLLGVTGYRAPVCVYCGSPNPRPLSEREWADVIMIAESHAVGDHVRTAIEKRQGKSGDRA